MTITLPALTPADWTLTLPGYPVITANFRSASYPEILGSLPSDSRWKLIFRNMNDSETLALLLPWRATGCGMWPLATLPAALAGGVNNSDFRKRLTGAAWTIEKEPLQEPVKKGRSNVTIELIQELAFELNPFAVQPPTSSPPMYSFTNTPLPSGNLPTLAGGPYLLGYNFTVSVNCVIEQIGVYNTTPANNSLGIWNFTDDPYNPIFQTVLTGTGNCTSDGFCWRQASGFSGLPTIVANKLYVIAAAWSGPVPASIETTGITLPAFGIGQTIGDNAYSIEELPSLSADLADYPPTETDTAYKKSFLNTNLVLRPL